MDKQYKKDFFEWADALNVSLEEYICNCRLFPHFSRDLTVLDEPSDNDELIKSTAKFGANEDALKASLYLYEEAPDEKHIEEAALSLMEAMINRDEANEKYSGHAVGRGKAIADSTIYRLTYELLRACSEHGISPPWTLTTLAGAALGAAGSDRSSTSPRRPIERRIAALLLAGDPTLSNRKIANALAINHTTVGRWKQEQKFQQMVKESGSIKGVKVLLKRPAE